MTHFLKITGAMVVMRAVETAWVVDWIDIRGVEAWGRTNKNLKERVHLYL
jgi:hypothetical protein